MQRTTPVAKRRRTETCIETALGKRKERTEEGVDHLSKAQTTKHTNTPSLDEQVNQEKEQGHMDIQNNRSKLTHREELERLNATDTLATRLLRDIGLHMTVIERDGHCLFSAVAMLVQQKMTRDELRVKAVAFVLEHFEEFRINLSIREPYPYNTRDEYKKGLEQDQGDQTEIIALGHITQKTIRIHELNENQGKIQSFYASEPKDSNGVIHLIRVGRNHFHAATEMEEKEEDPDDRSQEWE